MKRRKIDPLHVQLHIKIKAPRVHGKTIRPPDELIEKAISNWIRTGKTSVRGVTIHGITWTNPARGHVEEATLDDRDGKARMNEAIDTLHLRSIIRKRGIKFFRIRHR